MAFHFYYALLGIVALGLLRYQTTRKAPFPPGPIGLPFLGYIPILFERKPWTLFEKWKESYGPIVHMKILGKTIVVLNTHEAAVELLGRRSKIYNGRPRSILIDEMMTKGLAFPLVGYNDLWKRHRRAAQTVLNPRVIEQYHGVQERQSQRLVQEILRDPVNWYRHIKDSMFTLFYSVGYGETDLGRDDSFPSYLENFMTRIVQAAIPGSSLIDVFPVLASLPTWLSSSNKRYQTQFDNDSSKFEALISKLQHDTSDQASMGANLLGIRSAHAELNVKETAWLTAVLCGVGGEVTSFVLPIFFLAMTLYPETQRRAQLEIDTVIGKDGWPTFQERSKLPYVQAIVRELLRWRPIGPIGFPRCCLQDDSYEGCLIPEGAIVVPNIWAMNRDPQLYPDYEAFRPERFLDLEPDVLGAHGQGHVSYGFGDRICSGMHLANDALFISIATILHACNITKVELDGGADVFVDFGVVTGPEHFPCRISARTMDS